MSLFDSDPQGYVSVFKTNAESSNKGNLFVTDSHVAMRRREYQYVK